VREGMSEYRAPYLVERQTTSEVDWRPATYCRSLRYARQVALLELRGEAGISYRAQDLRTGDAIALVRSRPAVEAGAVHHPSMPAPAADAGYRISRVSVQPGLRRNHK
jgi:hypothetical protein